MYAYHLKAVVGDFKIPATDKAYLLLLLRLVRQMEIPVSSMKVPVHRRSPRIP